MTRKKGEKKVARFTKPRPLVRPRALIVSPLRYPGSKRRLAPYIQEVLRRNDSSPDLFIELFAGGASVSLHLLATGSVKRIGLVERDPLVAAFWQTVFFDSKWLVSQIKDLPISVREWRRWRRERPRSTRQRALKCLFLNRTSFSGILAPSAGPIGGLAQKSSYRIDCRFPRERIIRRIEQAAELRDRVQFVWQCSWDVALERIERLREMTLLPSDIFLYLDPPFFEKAEKLYTHSFAKADHLRLRNRLLPLTDPWILSYDASPAFYEHYGSCPHVATEVEMLYAQPILGGNRVAKEVIVANVPLLTSTNRLWRTNDEWKERA